MVEAPDLDAAYEMLVAGKADAFASDDILLSGYIATRPNGRKFRIVGDYLSYEPYAITLRRDDPHLPNSSTTRSDEWRARGRQTTILRDGWSSGYRPGRLAFP